VNSKLNIVVRVDLNHAKALVIAKGHITMHSVNALYVVVKRANSIKQGLDLELDISHAWVDDEALEQLQACSETHHLPAKIDPYQKPCTISVLAPRRDQATARPALIAA
jgi:propanediol utilization protein